MSTKQLKMLLSDDIKFERVSDYFFTNVDTDSSGQIEIFEFEKAVKRMCFDLGVNSPSIVDIQCKFEEIDDDGNGTINQEEFRKFVRSIFTKLLDFNNIY